MANVKLIFYGADGTEDHELSCFVSGEEYDTIFIDLDMGDSAPAFILLDKSTAIKFAKTLRTEINKMKEVGNE